MAVDLSMPVLVVDDYSTMIRIIRNLLKQLGFDNIDDASDGSAALNKMRGKKYGLVISDWNMEPMTGYDLLKEVRASPELSKTPFIMITAESKTENVIAAISLLMVCAASVLGASFIGAEYGGSGLSTQLLYEPRRARTHLSKMTAVGVSCAALGFVVLVIGIGLLVLL